VITLFTGSPGAGKTASMVDFLSKLPGDRPLYVHYDPASKRDPEQTLLSEGLKLPHTPLHADAWPETLPHGAILVIDEVQDVWRPRGSGSKVPPAIAALETHRHSGIDVYLTTQSPALVDSNVRALVGRHVHIRDTGFLGRYWYEWPEVSTGMTWKTCVNKKKFSLPKKAFTLYKSSSLHTVPVRGVPRAVIYGALSLVLLAVLVYGVYRIINRSSAPVVPAVATPSGLVVSQPAPTGVGGVQVRRIDDRVDFIPRVSNKPESAPAFDHLRVVVAMPVVSGALCVNDVCRCLTVQSTDTGLSSSECRSWVDKRPFNPYLLAVAPSPLPVSQPALVGPVAGAVAPL
jgi:zona occludens toxin